MAILDHTGAPFKQDVLHEPQTSSLIHLQRQVADHPAKGITPARLNQILNAAEEGDLIAQHELFEDMEERDGHLFSELAKRKRSLISLDWEIAAPRNASREEEAAAAWATEVLQDMADFEDILFDALDAISHGFSALEIEWSMVGREWIPNQLHHRPQSWFTLDQATRTQLRLRDPSQDGQALKPFGWMLHSHRAKSGYLARSGLGRILVWPYLFKHYSVGDLAEFLDICGIPIRIGKYPTNASAQEKSTLWKAVAGIGHAAAGIIPQSMALEFEQAAQGSEKPFEMMIRWAENTQTKAITGNLPGNEKGTGNGIGSGLADLANDVRKEIRDSDAKQLAGTITKQLVYPLLAINKGWADPRRCPRFQFALAEGDDIELYANALPKLVNIGMRIPPDWAHEKLRIPQAGDKDPVLATVPPADATPQHQPQPAPRKAALAALSGNAPEIDDALPGPQPDLQGMQAIDHAAQRLPPEQLDAQLQAMLTPVLQAIAQADSLEAAQAALDAATEHLDVTALGEALHRAGFAAHWMGRGDA